MGNLNRRQIYSYIEKSFFIHLGVGDKMLIYNMIREHNPDTLDDISHLILATLTEFDYNNKEVENRQKDQKIWLRSIADYIFERYKTK
jgi:hypothetical protein